MSEQLPQPSPQDDEFTRLMQGLEQDAEFAESITDLSGKMNLAEATAPRPTYEADVQRYLQRHEERPLGIRNYLVQLFKEVCEDYDIDPNSQQAPELYTEVEEVITAELHGLQKEIYAGDVIAVTNTMVVDIGGTQEGEGIRVLAIPEGIKVVGTFDSPIIGPMPDEINAVILNDSTPPAVGVGLVLTSPVVYGKDGATNTTIFEGRSVFVSLSPDSTELTKYHFLTNPAD